VGSTDVQELTRQLLLPGKDAAPLELDGGMGPSSFSEADIQVGPVSLSVLAGVSSSTRSGDMALGYGPRLSP
jgi:hypothetical protein